MNIIDPMQEISELTTTFNPITLGEMDDVRLLNRVDTKFLFPFRNLPVILEEMRPGYRILDINGTRTCRYENEYFDTEGLGMYLQHHNGKLDRFKIRLRTYLDSGQQFFEVKFKNNKDRTIKERIKKNAEGEDFALLSEQFLAEKTPYVTENLKTSLFIKYTRMTFVNNDCSERITIDIDLAFMAGERSASYPDLVIAELKQEKERACAFRSLMAKHHILNVSVSKYCLGIISLYDGVKYNRFKSKLNLIKKFSHVLS